MEKTSNRGVAILEEEWNCRRRIIWLKEWSTEKIEIGLGQFPLLDKPQFSNQQVDHEQELFQKCK